MNIKQLLSACILGTAIASCSFPSTEREGIVINLQEKGAGIAPSMYGVFFEEINVMTYLMKPTEICNFFDRKVFIF